MWSLYRAIGLEHFRLVLRLGFVLILLYVVLPLYSVVIFECRRHYDFIAILRCDLLVRRHRVVECLRGPLLVNDLRLLVHFRVEIVLVPRLFVYLHFFHQFGVPGFEPLMLDKSVKVLQIVEAEVEFAEQGEDQLDVYVQVVLVLVLIEEWQVL